MSNDFITNQEPNVELIITRRKREWMAWGNEVESDVTLKPVVEMENS